jgi:N-acetylneuraminate lyase
MAELGGIYPAIVTPITDDYRVNTDALSRLVAYFIDEGADGIWICGASGEAISFTEDERRLVTETISEAAAGRLKIIVHVGATNGLESARLAEHAEKSGADAVASVPPFFYPVNDATIVDHYRRLADSCSLPLFLYHLPGCTHVPMRVDLMEKLLDIPQSAGIKFSEADVVLMRQIKNLDPDRLTVLFGMDTMLLSALVMGADGGVGGTYNFIPGAYVRIHKAFLAGDYAAAEELQRAACDFVHAFPRIDGPIPFMKFVTSLLGFECGPPRPPLVAASKEKCEEYRRIWTERHPRFLDRMESIGDVTAAS